MNSTPDADNETTDAASSADSVVVYLARLAARDSEVGQLATAARHEILRRRGEPLSAYAFPPDRSEIRRIDWVHRGWLRPVRFVFRHMPVGLRRLVKKAAT
jgi:hypothetical protein